MNSTSFCLSLILFHFQRMSFLVSVSLTGRVSSFTTLKISSYSLLAWKISAKKSTDKLMQVPLYIRTFSSLPAFIILFVVFDRLVITCLGKDFLVWNHEVTYFRFGEFSPIISLYKLYVCSPFLVLLELQRFWCRSFWYVPWITCFVFPPLSGLSESFGPIL